MRQCRQQSARKQPAWTAAASTIGLRFRGKRFDIRNTSGVSTAQIQASVNWPRRMVGSCSCPLTSRLSRYMAAELQSATIVHTPTTIANGRANRFMCEPCQGCELDRESAANGVASAHRLLGSSLIRAFWSLKERYRTRESNDRPADRIVRTQ